MSERRKTVLVVDDDEGMCDTLTAVLKRDYHVLRAATGEVALQLMEKENVELMLLLPIERFPLDLNKAMGELVESMQTTAESAGLAIETELVFGPIYVEGDLFALNRVYRNLIMNALQATPPRGQVVVRTRRQNGQAVIEIADTGCGIPRERLDTIFDDFVTTKRRGLGLGLAISKKVVEQLDGTIAVESQVGLGSTFTLCFPLTKARPSKLAAV
jgi:signal transduction histidine kinase